MTLTPIGTIYSPFTEGTNTPIQPRFGRGVRGHIILKEPYVEGLADLEGFERVWLLFHLDRAKPHRMKVVPYRDTQLRGLFSTRAPSRPNPIGLSCVSPRVDIEDVDMLDGTPLIDIKPYVPRFDAYPDAGAGWLDTRVEEREKADDRFHK